MKVSRAVEKFLQKRDRFGTPVRFYFFGEDTVTTFVGGILTLSMYAVVICVFYLKVKLFVDLTNS